MRIFFLPGVPHEMKKMLDTEVIPVVCELKGVKGKFLEHRITLHGVAEASANELLYDFKDVFPSVTPWIQGAFTRSFNKDIH